MAKIVADLIHLTAEPQDQRRRNVWMVQYATQGTLQLLGIGTDGHSAAFAVWKRDHSVYVCRKRFVLEAMGDQLRGVCGAVAGSDYRDIVSHADPAIRTAV